MSYRKRIFPPLCGFMFTRTNDFKEHDGIDNNPQHDYVGYNSQGDIYPRRIYSMPMVDENIFRI